MIQKKSHIVVISFYLSLPFHLLSDGKSLAASRDVKFIETSSGIQHNVDELLVGVLKQVIYHYVIRKGHAAEVRLVVALSTIKFLPHHFHSN